MSERVLPHDLEAERAVLGCLLIEPERLSEVSDALAGSDYFRAAHQTIYRALLRLGDRGGRFDAITLCDALRQVGDLEEVGGPSYVSSLIDGVPRGVNLELYAGIVREKAIRRGLVQAAARIAQLAHESSDTPDALVEAAEQAVLDVGQRADTRDFVDAYRWFEEAHERLEARIQDRRAVTGVSTGFGHLDMLTRGFQPGDLIIVAARPAMGKTSLMMQLAQHAASTAPGMTAIFSVEMARHGLSDRAIASMAQINGMKLMTGRMSADEIARARAACSQLATLRWQVDDSPSLNLMQLRSRARRLKARIGLSLIVVDYIQIMDATIGRKRAENRTLELAQLSRGLKALAKELEVPVVVLAQLSRALEARQDKTPQLSDLRESGALEQDADVVIFIHRPEYYERDGEKKPENVGRALIIIAKQRLGPTGVVELRFTPEFTRFDNLTARTA